MVAKLGAQFYEAAFRPVGAAAAKLALGKVDEGLVELAPDKVLAGFKEGIDVVARATGLAPAEVGRMLPTGEMNQLVASMRERHQAASEVWKAGTGHGLLAGLTNLTIDARMDDAGMSLLRVAHKMAADKHIARPLSAFGEDVQQWEELLERSRGLIEDGEVLTRAFRRRRLIRHGAAAAVVLALAVAAWFPIRTLSARSDVDSGVAAAKDDPCEVEAIEERHLRHASDDQSKRVAQLREQCEARREAARKADKEREAAEKRRKRDEAERKKRAARCAGFIDKLEDGSLATGGDGNEAGLLQRLAARSVTPADLKLSKAKLPCVGTPSEKRVAAVYAQAVITSVQGWWRAAELPAATATLIEASKDGLTEKAVVVFGAHVERIAERVFAAGEPDGMKRADGLCRLHAKLSPSGHRQHCRVLVEFRQNEP
jgi:hypothetical protein